MRHAKEIKVARAALEQTWAENFHTALSGRAIRLDICACGVKLKRAPHFVRPRAHFKKGQLKPDAPSHVLKTPDIDNLAKFVLDALQKNILSDDKFVTTLVVHKRWCSTENEQRTEIELRVLN